MKSIIKEGFTILRQDGNRKLIISSHGGYLNSTLRGVAPANLHFMIHQNYCAKGQVTNVLAMSPREFETETRGTSGISDYALSNFEHDVPAELFKAVAAGFDVVTIQKGKQVKLSQVLACEEMGLYAYTDIYCMFCRVPMQATYVKVMF